MCVFCFYYNHLSLSRHENLNKKWNGASRKTSSPVDEGPLSINSSIVKHLESLSAPVVYGVSETQTMSDNNCHQTVWDRSNDSVWTRLDRWSR